MLSVKQVFWKFEHLGLRFIGRHLSSQRKGKRPMEYPEGIQKLSDRCQLVPSFHRDAWKWSADPSKVLILMMTWLGAKDRHVFKYSNLYTKQGMDVLIVKSQQKDFLWPPNSFALADHVYNVLENNTSDYEHIICHTFSAGSYNWTTLRELLKERGNPEHICGKFRGQVLDSVTAGSGKGGILEEPPVPGQKQVHAIDRMLDGVVAGINKGPVISWSVKALGKAFIGLTKKQTLESYEKSLKFLREEPLAVPTIFFCSRDDPMCEAAVLEKLVEIWKSKHNFPVSIKVWDSSPHTQHYLYHTEEYEKLHHELLNEIFSKLSSNGSTVKIVSKL